MKIVLLMLCFFISQYSMTLIRKHLDMDCASVNYTITQNQTPACFCDVNCTVYGDCCLDSTFQVDVNMPQQACEKFGEEAFFVKRECLNNTGNSSNNNTEKCLNNNYTIINKNFKGKIPVTSQKTGISYANRFCAICNNEERLISWNLKVKCTHNFNETIIISNGRIKSFLRRKYFREKLNYNNVTKMWQMQLTNQTENCTLYPIVPKKVQHIIRPCIYNINEMPSKTDKLDLTYCKKYQSAVVDKKHNRIYRNRICAEIDLIRNFSLFREMFSTNSNMEDWLRPYIYNETITSITTTTISSILKSNPRKLMFMNNTETILQRMSSMTEILTTKFIFQAILTSQVGFTQALTKPPVTNTNFTFAHTNNPLIITTNSTSKSELELPHNIKIRNYLLIIIQDDCFRILDKINATNVQTETIHYKSMNRTYIRKSVSQICNFAKICAVDEYVAKISDQTPRILPTALNTILLVTFAFLILSLYDLVGNKKISNQYQQIMISFVVAILINNGVLLSKNLINNSDEVLKLFNHKLNHWAFLISLVSVSASMFYASCAAWKVFYKFTNIKNNSSKHVYQYFYMILIWFLPTIITMLEYAFNLQIIFLALILLTFMNVVFYGNCYFIVNAEPIVLPRLAAMGINFRLFTYLILGTFLLWLIAFIANYWRNYWLIISFYVLNFIVCFLIYPTVSEHSLFTVQWGEWKLFW